MKKCLFTILVVVIGLSSILTIGNTLFAIVVQPLYSSPEQQSDDEQPADEEPVKGPEPEPEPEPQSEDLPISDERKDTPVTQEPLDPQAEKEVCVTNAKGQKFC